MTWCGVERRVAKKLLYLDDDQDELAMFRITANALGFDTTTVRYASDFIAEYETGKYDIAFVDFLLTMCDGVTLTRLLHKEKAPNTKLYIFSAFDKDLIKKKVNGDKINGVLDKSEGVAKTLAGVVNE